MPQVLAPGFGPASRSCPPFVLVFLFDTIISKAFRGMIAARPLFMVCNVKSANPSHRFVDVIESAAACLADKDAAARSSAPKSGQ